MSSVPAVLAALAALGAATLPNSQVINGGLGSITITQPHLFLVGDEAVEIERDFDSMSTVTMSEEYVVPLTITVDVPGTDQTVADNAAFADYEAFMQAVLDHPSGHTLGLEAAGVISVLPAGAFGPRGGSGTSHRFQRLADENGRHAAIRFAVRVYAQIT